MIIRKTISGVVLVLMLFNSGVTFAQEEDDDTYIDPYVDGNLSVAKCIAKGNLDFSLFLKSIIFSDGLDEAVFQPFVDVLFRNQCHATDVGSLLKQRDKIRKYIRDAFLTCKTQKLPGLRRAFQDVTAEIYYVRHVVEGAPIQFLPFGLLKVDEDEIDQYYYPRNKLYNEMKERFVSGVYSGYYNDQEFEQLFTKLEFKYEDRKKSYVVCGNDSWDRVVEKWEEFVESSGGVTPAIEKASKQWDQQTEKRVEAWNSLSLKKSLDGWVQVNLNDMDLVQGVEDISNNLDRYIPNLQVPTNSSLLSAIETAERQFDIEEMKRTMTANYAVLYKDTSDAAIGLFVEELNNWDNTIKETFPLLEAIIDCTEVMNNRQCPGKF